MADQGADATTAQALITKWRQQAVTGSACQVHWDYALKQCADELEAALVSPTVSTQGWQPVASAPEETLVLIHDEGYVGKAMLLSSGSWLDVECGRDDAFIVPAPTEWTALPAPPVVAAGPEEPT